MLPTTLNLPKKTITLNFELKRDMFELIQKNRPITSNYYYQPPRTYPSNNFKFQTQTTDRLKKNLPATSNLDTDNFELTQWTVLLW